MSEALPAELTDDITYQVVLEQIEVLDTRIVALSNGTLPSVFDEKPRGFLEWQQARSEQIRQWEAMFREAAHTPWEGRQVNGPSYPFINGMLGRCSLLLGTVAPEATPEWLMPSCYQRRETYLDFQDYLWEKGSHAYNNFRNIKTAKRASLRQHVDEQWPRLSQHELPPGLLAEPDFLRQHHMRSCAGISFLMVLDTLTGQNSNIGIFEDATSDTFGEAAAHDEEFLKLFQTRRFREMREEPVETISFVGADLETVRKLASSIGERLPDKDVYCVVSLLSDTTAETEREGIWHTNVLLRTEDDVVVVHDPANGPEREIPKYDFFQRWIQAYGRGHLIIA